MKDPFETLVEQKGEFGVWERMRRLESFRKFYQKYPYDDCEDLLDQDLGDYIDKIHLTPAQEVEANSYVESFLNSLPARTREVAERLFAEGDWSYDRSKPAISGAERWIKHDLKRRWQKYEAQHVA